MLVLSRGRNDKVVFPTLGISVEILRVAGNKVRLGIEAPQEVPVHRHEVSDRIAASGGEQSIIKLPAAQLEKPSLDVDKSYVFAQERGIVNAIGDLVGSDPNKEAQLYQLAEDKIAEAAESTELRTRAETNTRLMLESLVRGLGFERVTVTYTGT